MEINIHTTDEEDATQSDSHAMETQPSGDHKSDGRELISSADAADCGSGNHSSEEELEEINTNKKSYVEREERDCKRKWIETDTSTSEEEFEDPELKLELTKTRVGERSASTSTGSCCDTPSGSGDEDHVSTRVQSHTPVQFSTSPPVDVHKPRRSLSPPPKLFGLQQQQQHSQQQQQQQSVSQRTSLSSSLGDLSRFDVDIEHRAGCKKTISPRKKSKTSRVQHIQRPCLDFEKMQQMRARAVSWRHGAGGGELSLFCW